MKAAYSSKQINECIFLLCHSIFQSIRSIYLFTLLVNIMGNSILVLHPLIRHPKRMLQLLARTISIQDSNFKSWMLSSDYCLVWLFYINRFFLSVFSLFFFHDRALTPPDYHKHSSVQCSKPAARSK